ncbi:MAG TPA: response regulator [Cyanobacteria bacterium UBA8553]|nr:response regulator [Cyanobacteria bacterium UBA8553]
MIGGQRYGSTQPLILAVDDDEDNLLLLAYILEPFGCTLITAVDGITALSLARSYRPDLILLDILMPHMDGMEVIFQLRKDPKTRSIPAIAVTALALPQQRDRLLLAGFNDYVSKPYMLEDIEAPVRRHLRLKATIS